MNAQIQSASDYGITATYSPDDNKLRLYASSRLDPETYARVKALGFRWAPKQDLFVAPAWTPARADLLVELAGFIDDEDKSLCERAEERAERFEDYSDSRTVDANNAHAAVKRIADNIPFGQPILIGHHSEKHARKDAERIRSGMAKTIKAFETAEYWSRRAESAKSHAAYKEIPAVRARRIKGIEADLRKSKKNSAEADMFTRMWEKAGTVEKCTPREAAMFIANRDYISLSFSLVDYPREAPASQYEGPMSLWSALDGNVITAEQAADIAIKCHTNGNKYRARWIEHYENRLTYERAMLAESGGTVADKTSPEVGGGCQCWASHRGGWSWIKKVNKVSVSVLDNWHNGGANFPRIVPFGKLAGMMTVADVAAARERGELHEYEDGTGYFLTSNKAPENVQDVAKVEAAPSVLAADVGAMRDTLRAGVQVVVADQLFPTPKELAQRMVDAADIQPGHRVLEPSAGTGALLGAMGGRMFRGVPRTGEVVAVEINATLCDKLAVEFPLTTVKHGDFLGLNPYMGLFDRIVMNPPFHGGADIKHIRHAISLLAPGGRLVALCADGPRQYEQLWRVVNHSGGTWEALPPDSFKEQGTSVRVVMIVLDAPL